MQRFGSARPRRRQRKDRGRSARLSRTCWIRARVETDQETYEASLRADASRQGLDEILGDGRAYLGLFDAVAGSTNHSEDFLALHKGAIRSVTVLENGHDRAGGREG